MSEPEEAGPGAISPIPAPLYARMLPYLRESVLVVDAEWGIRANLSAPDGLLGWGDPTGIHLLAFVHPDDVLRFADTGTGLQETDPGWSGAARVRLKRSDETYGHYEITIHNCTDDPVLEGMVICTREVGPPVEAAADFGAADMVASLADQLPIGVVLLSSNLQPLYVNRAASELLGRTPDQIVGSGLQGMIEDVTRLEVAAILRELGTTPGRRTLTVAPQADRDRRLEVTFVSQTGAALTAAGSDDVLLIMATIEDVTHRIVRAEELEQRANRDELTGLKNRAWLLDHLHARLTAGAELTVAYIDLVGFKSVNDEHGHAAGDVVLAQVARAIADGIDDAAQAARVGGDEFVVVQEGAGDHAALAERIRGAVASATIAAPVSVAASVGIVRSEPGDEPWTVLARADQAMYADKRAAL